MNINILFLSSDMNLQVTEMENNNRRPKLMFEKYTWKINHFSKLNPEEELLSDKFRLNDFTWCSIEILFF